ncbi:MAG: adenylate kinase [Acidimicrobiaceae bacterium]|nr:adenylate kinase [Acidimicrobiaceae bacterium]
MAPLRMVILGRQGSGKGTQSERLTETFGCIHLSTGDVLRAAVAEGTELGRQAQAVMDSGSLVGDDIMNGIVRDRLSCADIAAGGVLLDGFPRTSDQADALEAILGGLDHRLDVAVNIEVPIDVVTARMLDRGRSDDTLEAIRRRLELYEEQTAPLLDWFDARGLLATVDGVGTPDEVFERVVAAVELHRRRA